MRPSFSSLTLHALLLGFLSVPVYASADTPPLPASVIRQSPASLNPLGGHVYRKFGFSVYHIALWSAENRWDTAKPYALQLTYRRDLSRATLVEGVMDGIREQDSADDATLADWEQSMQQALPDVSEGDTIVGLALPGEDAVLFHNERQIMKITDPRLSQAFFNVWLGQSANETTRSRLLGQKD